MDLESWQTASSDVKQLIISETDPATVRNFCRADRNSREICRDRLPAPVKFRSCLDSSESAQECDNIPMFSRQQFLTLIPKTILIYPDDPLQLTHEFYSQNYKLPTEGFSGALREAKIINTLCALIRPNLLIEYRKDMPALPPYINVSLIDRAVRIYKETSEAHSRVEPDDAQFSIHITARNSVISNTTVEVDVWYYFSEEEYPGFDVDIATDTSSTMYFTKLQDEFVSQHYNVRRKYPGFADPQRMLLRYNNIINDNNDYPNTFIVSRIIYDLIKKGFDDWRVRYFDAITGDPDADHPLFSTNL